VPEISTNSPIACAVPLSLMIVFGIGKELFMEIKRFLDDKKVNEKLTTRILRNDKGSI